MTSLEGRFAPVLGSSSTQTSEAENTGKYRSLDQDGETHATEEAQSKGACKLPLHFLHQYTSTLSTEKLLARTQNPLSPGLQSAGTWARQPVAQGRPSKSHPELTEERSQAPCRKPSHFCPSEGRDFPIYSW